MLRLAVMSAFALVTLHGGTAGAAEKLKVAVREPDNLEYLAFWAAKAGGSFERQGIDVEIVHPPKLVRRSPLLDVSLAKGEADAAIASPPIYLRMIAAKSPIVVVANLSQNDPFALVVRPPVMRERKISDSAPVGERLTALKGASLLVPPAAYGRLRALLASQAMDVGKDVKTWPLLSKDEAAPFAKESTEGAYLASPLLEKSVATGEAVVVVNQARAEVPSLANRQTNVFLVSGKMWTERRDVVRAAVRAIADAEVRIHTHQPEVVDALAREFPSRDRRELETIVRLYEPGVPATPEVRAEDLAPARALIAEGVPKPDLTGIDLAAYVSAEPITAAKPAPSSRRWLPLILAVLALSGVTFIIRRRRRA
jgi:ABC-type nitrate/sulfonate/bicarbonate transport system substrate-binding protein